MRPQPVPDLAFGVEGLFKQVDLRVLMLDPVPTGLDLERSLYFNSRRLAANDWLIGTVRVLSLAQNSADCFRGTDHWWRLSAYPDSLATCYYSSFEPILHPRHAAKLPAEAAISNSRLRWHHLRPEAPREIPTEAASAYQTLWRTGDSYLVFLPSTEASWSWRSLK